MSSQPRPRPREGAAFTLIALFGVLLFVVVTVLGVCGAFSQ